jgi:hypothetical protein
MRDGKILAVLLHLIGAEQLRSQWRFLVRVFPERVDAMEARRDAEQSFERCLLARVQLRVPLPGGKAAKARSGATLRLDVPESPGAATERDVEEDESDPVSVMEEAFRLQRPEAPASRCSRGVSIDAATPAGTSACKRWL